MMDVIKVTLTMVMRYFTIETRDINDDLIINVQSDMTYMTLNCLRKEISLVAAPVAILKKTLGSRISFNRQLQHLNHMQTALPFHRLMTAIIYWTFEANGPFALINISHPPFHLGVLKRFLMIINGKRGVVFMQNRR